MLNNCGGGKTPWGTVLTAEENFNQYFANNGKLAADDPRRAAHTRYGIPTAATEYRWENYYDRFDVAKEPNEAFRFGWVVEIDPFNPNKPPKKRSALGRTKHEAATTVIAPDERAVIYSGDDERFDYVYKFVTRDRVNLNNREANDGLLDNGVLYVAKLNDDGTGSWLPLVAGQGALATWTQADICIRTRLAADGLPDGSGSLRAGIYAGQPHTVCRDSAPGRRRNHCQPDQHLARRKFACASQRHRHRERSRHTRHRQLTTNTVSHLQRQRREATLPCFAPLLIRQP